MKYSKMIIEDYQMNRKDQLIDQISHSASNLEMFVNIISVYVVIILSFACLFIEMLSYKYKKFKKSCFTKELCRTRFKLSWLHKKLESKFY